MLGDYYCQLTDVMDEHLTDSYKEYLEYCRGTYIIEWNKGDPTYWGIRFPGATRGGIWVDKNMIITKIKLIEDTCFNPEAKGTGCYKRSIKEAVKQFIGTKLVFKERCEKL